MGLLDRFRTSKPPTTRPRGESGRGHIDGYLQLEELNADLAGQSGLQVFDKMYRSDPDVRKNLWMIINLLVGATWTVQPHGGDDAKETDLDAARFVMWALFENMRPNWKGHLAQALPVGLRSGFAPFEHLWETTEWDGREVIAPRMLDLRLPRTIDRWHQRDGQLTAIQQQLISGSATIPMTDLLYYRFGAEGDNWEGTSLLRPAYKPWLLKDKIERLDAIKQEREAVGVPICYPPNQATQTQREAMEEILINLRSGEQAFVMMPGPRADTMDAEMAQEHGWSLEILGHKQTESSDTKPSLDYHSDKIAAALLAEFMRLGQGSAPGGSRATADVQQNPFMQAAEALSAEVEAVVNDGLVARMVALNFEVEVPPRLVMSLVDSTSLNDLSDYVSKLVEKGVLKPDDELEDFLRDRADLPPASAEARKEEPEEPEAPEAPEDPEPEPEAPLVSPAPQSEPTDPPTPDADNSPKPEPEPRWGRELREWEQLMSLEEIDTAINQARDLIQQAAGTPALKLAREYGQAAEAGKAQPRPGSELTEAIRGELQRLYRIGQATVEDELDRQREFPLGSPAVSLADGGSMKDLKRRAELAATSIASRIWQAAVRKALIGGEPSAIQAAAEEEATASVRAEAQLHASASLNQGRDDAAAIHADEIRGARYTSILDSNRCGACSAADDDVLRPLNDSVRLARKPPNRDCHGGGRCRCIEFFELTDEVPGSPGGGGGGSEPPPNLGTGGGGSAADNFEVTGGTAETRQVVLDQIDAIDRVHRFPDGLPRTAIKIHRRDPGRYGEIEAQWDRVNNEWEWQKIRLSQKALAGTDPSSLGDVITSTIHEIGHYLDQWGFGSGATRVGPSNYYSATAAMSEWRQAVARSRAYAELGRVSTQPDYELSWAELLARSYEQFILEKSGDATLAAKIAARRRDTSALYWDEADFQPIAEAIERMLRTHGLM